VAADGEAAPVTVTPRFGFFFCFFFVAFGSGVAGFADAGTRTAGRSVWSVTPGWSGMTTTGPGDGGGMNGVVPSVVSLPASALPTEPAPGPIAARIGSDDVTAMNSTMTA